MNDKKYDNSNMQQNYVDRMLEAAEHGDLKSLQSGNIFVSALPKDATDERGWSPLMLATRNGHLEVVEFLLSNGADPQKLNKSGQSAIDIASFWNQHSITKLFKEHLLSNTSRFEQVNFYGHSSIDRQSYKRSDTDHIQSAMKSDRARFMVFAELQLLIAKSNAENEVVFMKWKDIEAALKFDLENDIIFLGTGNIEIGKLLRETQESSDDDLDYFAINFKKKPTEQEFPIECHKGHFVDKAYNRGITIVKKKQSGMVAQARSVLAWHDSYLFCPTCGNKTSMGDSGYKRVCTSDECVTKRGAHNTSFPRTDPVVIVLITSKDGSKCLLGRQKRFPPMMYSCVAGFMEPGESIEDAARREVLEETGVKVGQLKYHSSQPWPFPSNLMVGLIGHAICDDIKIDEIELEDAKWFDRQTVAESLAEGFNRSKGIKIPPPYAIAHQLIKSWLQITSNL